MKYLGVGLSKTGTTSLTKAMELLGFNSIHWNPEKLRNVIFNKKSSLGFKVYDDFDFVCDLPASIFYKQLKEVYPKCKIILTVREENEWFESIKRHYEETIPNHKFDSYLMDEIKKTQILAYGSEKLNKKIYIENYKRHNSNVLLFDKNALVLNITTGDGWNELCKFVNKNTLNVNFPWKNKHEHTRILDGKSNRRKRDCFYKIFY